MLQVNICLSNKWLDPKRDKKPCLSCLCEVAHRMSTYRPCWGPYGSLRHGGLTFPILTYRWLFQRKLKSIRSGPVWTASPVEPSDQRTMFNRLWFSHFMSPAPNIWMGYKPRKIFIWHLSFWTSVYLKKQQRTNRSGHLTPGQQGLDICHQDK